MLVKLGGNGPCHFDLHAVDHMTASPPQLNIERQRLHLVAPWLVEVSLTGRGWPSQAAAWAAAVALLVLLC